MFLQRNSIGQPQPRSRIYISTPFPDYLPYYENLHKLQTSYRTKVLTKFFSVVANFFTRKICNQPQNPSDFFSCCCKFFYTLFFISTTAISTASLRFGQKLSTTEAPAPVSLHYNTIFISMWIISIFQVSVFSQTQKFIYHISWVL